MKLYIQKIALCIALALTTMVNVYAQAPSKVENKVNAIVKKYENVKGVDCTTVTKGMGLNMVKMMFNKQFGKEFMKGVTSTFCMYRLSTDNSFYPYRKDTKDSIAWKPGYIATAWAKTSETLHDECYNYFRFNQAPKDPERLKALQAFKAALEDNVLYRDWTPAHPIFLYHSVADEVVVFENYQNCLNAWTGSDMVKGTRYKGLTKTHVNYGSIFFLLHCDEGINAILDNKVDKFKFDRLLYGI